MHSPSDCPRCVVGPLRAGTQPLRRAARGQSAECRVSRGFAFQSLFCVVASASEVRTPCLTSQHDLAGCDLHHGLRRAEGLAPFDLGAGGAPQATQSRFTAHSGRLWVRDKAATGTCGMAGFSVMRSPVGIGPRPVEGSQGRRLWIDLSDAYRCSAPGSKRKANPSQG